MHPLHDPRLTRNIVVTPDACWLWGGATTPGGYGIFSWRIKGADKTVAKGVHRVAYEMVNGPIPPGLTIDHLCRRKNCLNPAHLEAVTIRENIMRGDTAAARLARRTRCPRGHSDYRTFTSKRNGRPIRTCRICERENYKRWYRAHKPSCTRQHNKRSSAC